MEILIIMFLGLLFSFLLGEGLSKFNLPKIIAPIIIGSIFALEPFSSFIFANVDMDFFELIKDIALVFLLFFVGLKINIKHFKNLSRKSLLLGLFASIVPLIVGFFSVIIVSYLFDFNAIIGSTNIILIAFLVGVIFSVTAECIIIEVLEELGLIESSMGQTVLGAGIVDDVISIFLITIITTLFADNSTTLEIGYSLLFKLFQMFVFSTILFLVATSVLPRIIKLIDKKQSKTGLFSISLMISFFLAMVTQFFELGGLVLGAILGGVIVNYVLAKDNLGLKTQSKTITEMIEIITFGFFAPFFYIWIGLNVDLTIFIKHPYYILFFFLFLSFSKLFGSMVGNKLGGGTLKEGFVMGFAMNSKAGLEIMILSLALTSGVISSDLFSILIGVTFLATLISPIIFERLIKDYYSKKTSLK